MVTLNMLVKEVRVHELCVSPSSRQFVYSFSFVHKLVTTNSIEATEVSPLEAEEEVLSIGFWFKLEPVTVNVHLVRHDDKCPQPGQSFKNVESIKWGPESLVVQVSSLAFLGEVLVVFRSNEV